MDALFDRVADPSYLVLIIIIVLQQKQIMGYGKIIDKIITSSTELSTLIKVMLSRRPNGNSG